jgi:hypothetical protein
MTITAISLWADEPRQLVARLSSTGAAGAKT